MPRGTSATAFIGAPTWIRNLARRSGPPCCSLRLDAAQSDLHLFLAARQQPDNAHRNPRQTRRLYYHRNLGRHSRSFRAPACCTGPRDHLSSAGYPRASSVRTMNRATVGAPDSRGHAKHHCRCWTKANRVVGSAAMRSTDSSSKSTCGSGGSPRHRSGLSRGDRPSTTWYLGRRLPRGLDVEIEANASRPAKRGSSMTEHGC